MRQVWITRAGGPEVLEVRESADPRPATGEVRIRVEAAGVNFADIMARMGQYPDAPPIPCVVGYEVAGVIDALGSGVEDLQEGDRVLSFTQFGGYSDVVCVPAAFARPIPEGLSMAEAAAIPVNYLTAWIMLIRKGHLKAGETVLVHSGGGGVGIAALQICQWRSARFIGTASSGKHKRLLEMGANHCVDYRTQDFEAEVARYTQGRGVDIALDAQGGKSFKKSYRALAPMGRLFCFGGASLSPGKKRSYLAIAKGLWSMPFFHPLGLMDTNRGVFGTNMGHLWSEFDRLGDDMGAILRLVGEGEFKPVVDSTYSFNDAAEAHAYMQDRKNFGKVVLVP